MRCCQKSTNCRTSSACSRLGDAGVGVAEDALGGIAGQEDQDALLAAAAAGDVVLLQRLFLGIGRDGVEVEIERSAARQAGPMHLVGPGVQQPQVGAVIDPASCRRPGTSAWGRR